MVTTHRTQITNKQLSKVIRTSAKRVIASAEINTSTRQGNKELDFIAKRLAASPSLTIEGAEKLGNELGEKIVTLSQSLGRQNLDKGVIHQLAVSGKLPNWGTSSIEHSQAETTKKTSQKQSKSHTAPQSDKSKEPIAEETVVEETAVEETVVEKSIAEETVVEETGAEETVVEKSIAEETDAEETDAEETDAEETVAEESIAEEPVTSVDTKDKVIAEETDESDNLNQIDNTDDEVIESGFEIPQVEESVTESIAEETNAKEELLA